MPRGFASHKVPNEIRERAERRRPNSSDYATYLLFQIRSELNPGAFTFTEVEEEFGTATSERGFRQEDRLRKAFSKLEGDGSIEEYQKGMYRVTEAGMSEPDPDLGSWF